MATEILVPVFGESVVEATVGHWMKREGETVTAGEPVVELETEKVNTEVAAPEAGVLARIVRGEGETVHPGDVLGIIEQMARATAPAAPAAKEEQVKPAPAAGQEAEKVRVSPMAQRLAAELSVNVRDLHGSGPGGRVMREDVEAQARRQEAPAAPSVAAPPAPAPAAQAPAAAAPAPSPAAPAPPAAAPPAARADHLEVRQRLSRRRLTIARRMVEAQQTAAMLTTFNEIDMGAVVELRRRRREEFRKTTGVDLGYMSFFVKAVVGALKAFPVLNSELQGEELVLKRYYDIGIAIGNPEGLVVPVVRDADRLSFAQIEEAISAFIKKANEHTLTLEDLRGGTFTITNGGVFGSLLSTPILNPPQVGILGMHKISDRPMAVNGEVVIRPMMFVALTYDHRVVDGRDAVLFLVRVKELIEDPARLLLEG